MTVSTSTSRADATGNGVTTAFTANFRILDQTHIVVYRTQISTGAVTTLALTTDYTVSGVGGTSFTVTCVTAPTSDQRLSILRNVPFTQVSSYPLNDVFPSTTTEQALDKLTMEVQQLAEVQGRSLSLSANSSGVSAALPSPSANQLIGWDSSAAALANYSPTNLGINIYAASWTTQTFSGDGSTTSFVLTSDAGVASNCDITVGGVGQTAGINFSYTASTKTITFLTGAPPSGTNNVAVRYGQALPVGTVASTGITDSTAFGRRVITAASASAAGVAASGANNDITSLGALTTVPTVVSQYASQVKTIGASVAANALTITAGALSVDFRSTTLGSGTVTTVSGTPASLVVPSTATLGTVNATQSDLIVLALNNAGAIELAVVNLSGGVDLSETGLISTTAISAAATSASVVYSTTARSNVAYRVIGLVRSTQATAGTWATAPSLVQGMGGNALNTMQSLGFGQTAQPATIVGGTTYYNTSGKTQYLYFNPAGSTSYTITLGGSTFASFTTGSATFSTGFPIPAGFSYSLSSSPTNAYILK